MYEDVRMKASILYVVNMKNCKENVRKLKSTVLLNSPRGFNLYGFFNKKLLIIDSVF